MPGVQQTVDLRHTDILHLFQNCTTTRKCSLGGIWAHTNTSGQQQRYTKHARLKGDRDNIVTMVTWGFVLAQIVQSTASNMVTAERWYCTAEQTGLLQLAGWCLRSTDHIIVINQPFCLQICIDFICFILTCQCCCYFKLNNDTAYNKKLVRWLVWLWKSRL